MQGVVCKENIEFCAIVYYSMESNIAIYLEILQLLTPKNK